MEEHLPLNQNVLVEVLAEQEEKTSGGLIIPEKDKRLPRTVRVKEVSPHIEDPKIQPGDLVTVYLGAINSVNNEGLALVAFESILTIVKNG